MNNNIDIETAQSILRDAEFALAEAAAMKRHAPKDAAIEAARTYTAAKMSRDEAKRHLAAVEKAAKIQAAMRAAAGDDEDPLEIGRVDFPALARWIARQLAGRACYVEGAGWGAWTGACWTFSRNPSPELLDAVRETYCNRVCEVAATLNAQPKAAQTILEHAQAALRIDRRLFNAPGVAHLVAFQNVTVDLRTGATMQNSPAHYMTGALTCDYDETADSDRIDRTFARFWPEDEDTLRAFHEAIGYSLTGETAAKRTFFLVGNQENALSNGDNGKSLVQNALAGLFGIGAGGWGAAIKAGIIIDTGDRDANSHDGAKVPLIWKRFAMASEFRAGSAIDAGEFNRLSGGDVQTARPPHAEHAVEFVNVATCWFSMNSTPRFKTYDRATRIRLTPFPFNETFYDADRVPEGGQVKEAGLAEWLASEEGRQALAAWAVQGAVAWYARNGGAAGNLLDSAAINELREKILRSSSPHGELIEDSFVVDGDVDTSKAAVIRVLRDSLPYDPKQHEVDAFIRALEGLGATHVKIRGTRYLRGIALTTQAAESMRMIGREYEIRRVGGSNVRAMR